MTRPSIKCSVRYSRVLPNDLTWQKWAMNYETNISGAVRSWETFLLRIKMRLFTDQETTHHHTWHRASLHQQVQIREGFVGV